MAGSVARTLMLQRQPNLLAAWAGRAGGWRRAFLAVGLFVVAFSIVGMHQLSLDHELASPTPPTASTAVAHDAGHQHRGHRDHDGADHFKGPGSPSLVEFSAPQVLMAVSPADGSSGGHEESCAGCGSHTMALGACLLALTLLVLFWWLAPPRVRLLPPRLLARPVVLMSLVYRRVPALSLAELSILRT